MEPIASGDSKFSNCGGIQEKVGQPSVGHSQYPFSREIYLSHGVCVICLCSSNGFGNVS